MRSMRCPSRCPSWPRRSSESGIRAHDGSGTQAFVIIPVRPKRARHRSSRSSNSSRRYRGVGYSA